MMNNISVITAATKKELDERIQAFTELGRVNKVIKTYQARTSAGLRWIVEFEDSKYSK